MKVLKWWAWFLLLSSPYHSTSANRGTYTQTDTDIESLNVKSSLCCCHRSCVGWRVHIRVAPGMALMGRDWGSTIGAVDLAGTISFFNPWTLAFLVSIASTSPPMHPDQPAAIYATGFYLLFCFRHVSFMPFPSFFFPLDKFVFFKPVFFLRSVIKQHSFMVSVSEASRRNVLELWIHLHKPLFASQMEHPSITSRLFKSLPETWRKARWTWYS